MRGITSVGRDKPICDLGFTAVHMGCAEKNYISSDEAKVQFSHKPYQNDIKESREIVKSMQ